MFHLCMCHLTIRRLLFDDSEGSGCRSGRWQRLDACDSTFAVGRQLAFGLIQYNQQVAEGVAQSRTPADGNVEWALDRLAARTQEGHESRLDVVNHNVRLGSDVEVNYKGTVRLAIKARPRSYTAAMPTARDPLYQGHRFPLEVISHAVWLYFRFPLSLRMVEEMLATRGICVTYETVRQWGKKFGKAFADQIRQRACSRRQMAYG
jgi:hypothetical protein